MKRALLFTAILAAAILTACSHIDEDERYIYEKLEQADRVVLLEDFTGQRCVNCPRGTEVIEQLQKEFGDKVIAVGIHGGPLGFAGTATARGLATNVGDEYYDHWKLEYQPVGLVNRHGAVNYTDWTKEVVAELAKPARLNLSTQPQLLDDQSLFITVRAQSTEGTINGTAIAGYSAPWSAELPEQPFTVPEGEYFVLGDRYGLSVDSRSPVFGTVRGENVVGTAKYILWPAYRIGEIR